MFVVSICLSGKSCFCHVSLMPEIEDRRNIHGRKDLSISVGQGGAPRYVLRTAKDICDIIAKLCIIEQWSHNQQELHYERVKQTKYGIFQLKVK